MIAEYWQRVSGSVVIAATLRGQRAVPYLPRAKLEALRDRRVRDIVSYAARTVPFYRDWFEREDVDPRSIRSAADLDRLPLLDKELVRSRPELFLAESFAARGSLSFSTSGTTGVPLEVHHDRRSLLANIAYGEREREPVNRGSGSFRPKELYVGYETSTFKKVQTFYEASTLMPLRPRRTFVSLLAPVETIAAISKAERPDVLVGYGGWIDLFFKTVTARDIPYHAPKMVMYMGEALPHGARELVEGRLGIPLLSRYNAVESFKIGFFCDRRTGFHLHEDLCHVRIARPDGSAAGIGEQGAIVLSNLVNRATVLLNYPIGDVGSLSSGVCACGRTLKLLSELEGRVEDLLLLPDGRVVHPRSVWQVLKESGEVLQYQLIQQEPSRFALTLVTVDPPSFARVRDHVLPGLRKLLGENAVIEPSHRSEIDRGAGGKFRAVASRCRPSAAATVGVVVK
jgi:phenylacetate-CoA ligase